MKVIRNERFLIADYTDCTGLDPRFWRNSDRVVYEVVTGSKSLVQRIDNAKENNLKIAVWQIGECLLDWS